MPDRGEHPDGNAAHTESTARLIVFAGLTGVGKSAVADRVSAVRRWPILSVDPIEDALASVGYDESFTRGLAGYVVAARVARHLLGLGQTVVVEAVNAEPEGRATWHDLAAAVGVETEWVQVVCSDPSLHRRRLEHRTSAHPGLAEPSWDAVTARATGFDGWDDERLVVDAIDPLDVVVDRVLDHLTAR